MPSTAERLGVVETKVENLSEKIDGVKGEVKQVHECLHNTRDELSEKLEQMYQASCTQHAELAKKISSLEKIRDKITWMTAGAVAFAGILIGHLDKVVDFLK